MKTIAHTIGVVLLATMLWGSLSACGKKAPPDDSAAWALVPVKKGDAVVARDSKNYDQLSPGKAIEVKGGKVKVQFDGSKNEAEFNADSVYLIPRDRLTLRVKIDDLVIFRDNDKKWHEGTVTKASDRSGMVRTSWGDTYGIGPNSTIKLSEAQNKLVRMRLDGRKIHDAAKKLYPEAPKAYKPKDGERVIGIVIAANFWEPGKASKDSITWDQPSVRRHQNASKPTRLAPIPTPEQAPPLKKDAYVLVKNNNPKKFTWKYAQVKEVKGKKAEVLTQDGEQYQVGPGEYALLNRPY